MELQHRSNVSWQSLVSWSLRLKTRFSIRQSFQDRVLSLEDRVLSLDDRGLRIKFQILSLRELVMKAHSLKVYTYLSFWKLPLYALGETRSL